MLFILGGNDIRSGRSTLEERGKMTASIVTYVKSCISFEIYPCLIPMVHTIGIFAEIGSISANMETRNLWQPWIKPSFGGVDVHDTQRHFSGPLAVA